MSQLLLQRASLQGRLRKQQEMAQLQQLLAEERLLLAKRKMTTQEMLRDIGDLEQQADDVERNAQRSISELRTLLERLAQRCEELTVAKAGKVCRLKSQLVNPMLLKAGILE